LHRLPLMRWELELHVLQARSEHDFTLNSSLT
jgi:hypothetical protein